jgi:hypothetical protein
MKKINIIMLLYFLTFSQAVKATQIPMVGDFKFAITTNTRAVRFSGDVKASKGSVQRIDQEQNHYEVHLSLDPNWFKTGINLRDEHLRDKILMNRPLVFVGSAHCPTLECKAQGQLVLGDHQGEIEIALKWSENRENLKGEAQLSLKGLGLEAPSYLGVTVQDLIPVEFQLQVLK